MIARRDPTEFGFWAGNMDRTIGLSGIVEALDYVEELVFVRFLDVNREISQSHWYPIECLEAPRQTAMPTAFFLFSEAGGAKTVAVRLTMFPLGFYVSSAYRCFSQMALESDICILTCRRAVNAAVSCASQFFTPKKLRKLVMETMDNGRVIAELIKSSYHDSLLSVDPSLETFVVPTSPELRVFLNAMLALLQKAPPAVSSKEPESRVVEFPCALLVVGDKRKWKKATLSITGNQLKVQRKDEDHAAVFVTQKIRGKVVKRSPESDMKKRSLQLEIRALDKSQVYATISFKAQEDLDEARRTLRLATKEPVSPSWDSTSSIADNVVAWCVGMISDTPADTSLLEFESPHPYPSATAFRRYASVKSASHLLVVFDPRSHTQAGVDFLTFWKDAGLRQPLAVFHGRGALNFPVTVIHGNEFWITFETDPAGSGHPYWGYSFVVLPLVPSVMRSPTVDVLFTLQFLSWMLDSSTQGISQLACKQTFEALWKLTALASAAPAVRARSLIVLERITQSFSSSSDSADWNAVLATLEKEVNERIDAERVSVAHSFSAQTKALCQLAISIANRWSDDSSDSTKAARSATSPKPSRRPAVGPALTSKWPSSVRAIHAVSKAFCARLNGSQFPIDFVKGAFVSDGFRTHHLTQIEETSHPYPPNADISSALSFRGAREILVEFDPRCFFVPHGAILLFESNSGQELARFAENVFPYKFRLPVDSFVWKFISNRAYPEWGFRFSVTPAQDRKAASERAHRLETMFRVAIETQAQWDYKADCHLVRWVNATVKPPRLHSDCSQPSCDPAAVFFSISDCDLSQISTYLPQFKEHDRDLIEARLELIKYLNHKVSKALPFVDLTAAACAPGEGGLAILLSRCKGLIFQQLKSQWLSAVLQESSTNLLRPKLRLQRRRQRDRARSTKLFEQAMDQLLNIDPARLQRNDRAFEVNFEDEGAQDIGGPYRETLSQICNEIQSTKDLFIPTPNGKAEVGDDQDKVIPNPPLASENRRALEFIGRLIGISIRTKSPLELTWPSLIWRRLVGEEPTLEDLEGIDFHAARLIRSLHRDGFDLQLTEVEFNESMAEQTFTVVTFDDRHVPLLSGGESIPLRWADRQKFADLYLNFKLSELSEHCNLIARGIASILPLELIQLFTSQELESLVCGVRVIDATLLMAHTKYAIGVDPASTHIKWFWRVVKAFSDEQRQKLLRFISGRSRLPSTQQWASEFTINPFFIRGQDASPDRFLPTAHTCFFSLDLPEYSSEDILRQKLVYAITNCIDMDTDFNVANRRREF